MVVLRLSVPRFEPQCRRRQPTNCGRPCQNLRGARPEQKKKKEKKRLDRRNTEGSRGRISRGTTMFRSKLDALKLGPALGVMPGDARSLCWHAAAGANACVRSIWLRRFIFVQWLDVLRTQAGVRSVLSQICTKTNEVRTTVACARQRRVCSHCRGSRRRVRGSFYRDKQDIRVAVCLLADSGEAATPRSVRR